MFITPHSTNPHHDDDAALLLLEQNQSVGQSVQLSSFALFTP